MTQESAETVSPLHSILDSNIFFCLYPYITESFVRNMRPTWYLSLLYGLIFLPSCLNINFIFLKVLLEDICADCFRPHSPLAFSGTFQYLLKRHELVPDLKKISNIGLLHFRDYNDASGRCLLPIFLAITFFLILLTCPMCHAVLFSCHISLLCIPYWGLCNVCSPKCFFLFPNATLRPSRKDVTGFWPVWPRAVWSPRVVVIGYEAIGN